MLNLFFDTETTGIPDWKIPSDDPSQPHITQLAAKVVDMDTLQTINSMNVIVCPDGWTIPQDCVDLNGLTTERALEVGMPEEDVVRFFLQMWNGMKRRAYNTTFDNRIIRIATKRYFPESVQEAWKAGDYECVMIAAKNDMGVKSVKLVDAYTHYCGESPDYPWHDAMADVDAAIAVHFAMLDQYDSSDPVDFD